MAATAPIYSFRRRGLDGVVFQRQSESGLKEAREKLQCQQQHAERITASGNHSGVPLETEVWPALNELQAKRAIAKVRKPTKTKASSEAKISQAAAQAAPCRAAT